MRELDGPTPGYTFVDPVIREYFAGLGLVGHSTTARALAERALDPSWRGAVVYALTLRSADALVSALDEVWEIAEAAPPSDAWVLRSVAIDAGLQGPSRLRESTLERAWAAVDHAREHGEPRELWTSVAARIEDEDYPC